MAPPSRTRTFEGLRMTFNLDDLKQCTLINTSSYRSEGYHKYYTKEFMEHCMQTIILATCFPMQCSPQDDPDRFSNPSSVEYPYENSVFYYVEQEYNFQRENVLNNAEDVILTLLCIFTRQFPEHRVIHEFTEDLMAFSLLSLAEYHGKLFESYVKWTIHVGWKHMFPWKETQLPYQWNRWSDTLTEDQRLAAEASMLMFEIMLYRSIWGELSCGRHLPECINFLFRWGIKGWKNNETEQPPFLDVVTVLSQRIRDEQWLGTKKNIMIDHKDRLHYDDLNELFWSSDCVKWLDDAQRRSDKANDPEIGRLSAKNMSDVLNTLCRTDQATKGRKTFTEIRSYFLVFLSFWRVIYFHTLWFPLTWAIYKYLNGGEEQVYEACVTIMPTILTFIKATLELIIGGWSGSFHKRAKKGWTMYQYIKVLLQYLLCTYVSIFYFLYGTEGRCFRFRSIHGLLCAWPVLMIYLVKESHYLLFCRFNHSRKSHSLVSRGGFVGRLVRLLTFWSARGDFIGRKALVGLPITDVIFYNCLWSVIWGIKTVYWVFMMCPIINESISYLGMVELRPFYVANVAIVKDLGSVVFWIGVWVPTFAMYFYDSQVSILVMLGGVIM